MSRQNTTLFAPLTRNTLFRLEKNIVDKSLNEITFLQRLLDEISVLEAKRESSREPGEVKEAEKEIARKIVSIYQKLIYMPFKGVRSNLEKSLKLEKKKGQKRLERYFTQTGLPILVEQLDVILPTENPNFSILTPLLVYEIVDEFKPVFQNFYRYQACQEYYDKDKKRMISHLQVLTLESSSQDTEIKRITAGNMERKALEEKANRIRVLGDQLGKDKLHLKYFREKLQKRMHRDICVLSLDEKESEKALQEWKGAQKYSPAVVFIFSKDKNCGLACRLKSDEPIVFEETKIEQKSPFFNVLKEASAGADFSKLSSLLQTQKLFKTCQPTEFNGLTEDIKALEEKIASKQKELEEKQKQLMEVKAAAEATEAEKLAQTKASAAATELREVKAGAKINAKDADARRAALDRLPKQIRALTDDLAGRREELAELKDLGIRLDDLFSKSENSALEQMEFELAQAYYPLVAEHRSLQAQSEVVNFKSLERLQEDRKAPAAELKKAQEEIAKIQEEKKAIAEKIEGRKTKLIFQTGILESKWRGLFDKHSNAKKEYNTATKARDKTFDQIIDAITEIALADVKELVLIKPKLSFFQQLNYQELTNKHLPKH